MPSPPVHSRPRDIRHFHVRNLGHYFLRGVLVLAPVLITFTVLLWLFLKVDGWVNPYPRFPGVGFLALIAVVLLVGWLGSYSQVHGRFKVVDRVLEQLPGVSFIYSSVRDFIEAFFGRKRRFKQAVLVSVFSEDVWIVGFLTDENAGNFELGDDYVSVYVPQAYNFAGQLYVVPRNRVRPIEGRASPDVMKYAVTGGAVEIKETGGAGPEQGTPAMTPGPKPA